jgi:endonuclease YncB( thermonuclease family)
MKSLLINIAALFLATPAFAEPVNPSDILVVDGDTIRIHSRQPNVRLVGFNAPETRNATCQAEADLGARATQRLRNLVKLGNLDLEMVACSCPAFACNYARNCGTLKASGRDVGAILIEEKLAVPFICGATRCLKTPRPWCQ